MRLPHLLVVWLVFSSLSLAFAEDQPRPTEKPPTNIIKADSANRTPGDKPIYRFWRNDPSQQVSLANPDLDATCYTMRTYVVQRDDRQSDSVHPVRYTTCQSAPRFEVKVTAQPVENNSHRK